MSLVSTAFPWTNDEEPNKKRTPAMNRKTVKSKPSASAPVPVQKQDFMIYDVVEVEEKADERTNRVTEIINQMSAVAIENDGSGLADFAPPPNPAVQQKKPFDTNLGVPLQMPPSMDRQITSNERISYNYPAYTNDDKPLGNYREVYSGIQSVPSTKPYYSMMGLSNGVEGFSNLGGDSKLLDKINYMIHMLENMEAEKTANITEEFVLYSFTGIFIIFVLDTFLKTGKYVR
jgi:hypothetical protein